MSFFYPLPFSAVPSALFHFLVYINLGAGFGHKRPHIFPEKAPQGPEQEQQHQQEKQGV